MYAYAVCIFVCVRQMQFYDFLSFFREIRIRLTSVVKTRCRCEENGVTFELILIQQPQPTNHNPFTKIQNKRELIQHF